MISPPPKNEHRTWQFAFFRTSGANRLLLSEPLGGEVSGGAVACSVAVSRSQLALLLTRESAGSSPVEVKCSSLLLKRRCFSITSE